jgi:hypothetical protein
MFSFQLMRSPRSRPMIQATPSATCRTRQSSMPSLTSGLYKLLMYDDESSYDFYAYFLLIG